MCVEEQGGDYYGFFFFEVLKYSKTNFGDVAFIYEYTKTH